MENLEDRYDHLTDRVSTLYDEGLQQVALDLLDSAGDDLAPWTAELAHLRACLLGSIGESTKALVALQEASAAGAWWEEGILTEDDDLAALQYLPAFQAVVELSRARKVTAEDPPLIAHPEGEACGVVVALHGAGQRAVHAMRDWAAVLDFGYALVGVESSQLMSPMYRTWPDPAQSAKDIARALSHLPEELRDLPLIAAGFSAGGRVALNWAVEADPVPAAGVVVLAPALRALPEKAQGALSPASILIGAADELLAVVDDAEARLSTFGVTIDRIPGLAHEFPQDFAARLGTVLPSCG